MPHVIILCQCPFPCNIDKISFPRTTSFFIVAVASVSRYPFISIQVMEYRLNLEVMNKAKEIHDLMADMYPRPDPVVQPIRRKLLGMYRKTKVNCMCLSYC